MGYSLECYALALQNWEALVGSGRRDVAHAVVEADPFLSSPGVAWHGALWELVSGVRERWQ